MITASVMKGLNCILVTLLYSMATKHLSLIFSCGVQRKINSAFFVTAWKENSCKFLPSEYGVSSVGIYGPEKIRTCIRTFFTQHVEFADDYRNVFVWKYCFSFSFFPYFNFVLFLIFVCSFPVFFLCFVWLFFPK